MPTDTSALFPGVAASDDETSSGIAWSTPSDALTEDGAFATIVLPDPTFSASALALTDFDFSVALPSGSYVINTLVQVKCKVSTGSVNLTVRPYASGASFGGTQFANISNTTLVWVDFESEFFWNQIPDDTFFNSGVGVAINAAYYPFDSSTTTVYVDAVKVTLTYITEGGGGGVISGIIGGGMSGGMKG